MKLRSHQSIPVNMAPIALFLNYMYYMYCVVADNSFIWLLRIMT